MQLNKNKNIKLIAIIGARPQFIKHFAFEKASENKMDLITIHTGQHFDENMSNVFFKEFGMAKPQYILSNGGGNHGAQTGKMMIDIEDIVLKEKPTALLVYGDTNSTLAGALVAVKLHIPIIHVEAGLRSYNRQMPEEINRIVADVFSNLLFVSSDDAIKNLLLEGITKNVNNAGDIMKDVVLYTTSKKLLKLPNISFPFFYVTLHRPYNTDEKIRLKYVLDSLNKLNKKAIFSIHPRTRIAMQKFGLLESNYSNILFIDPQPYFENLGYLYESHGLITDSGGMQKEAYWLKKPCVTVRSETEWKETLGSGTNQLLFHDLTELNKIINNNAGKFDDNLYGDGKSAEKMVQLITDKFYTL